MNNLTLDSFAAFSANEVMYGYPVTLISGSIVDSDSILFDPDTYKWGMATASGFVDITKDLKWADRERIDSRWSKETQADLDYSNVQLAKTGKPAPRLNEDMGDLFLTNVAGTIDSIGATGKSLITTGLPSLAVIAVVVGAIYFFSVMKKAAP